MQTLIFRYFLIISKIIDLEIRYKRIRNKKNDYDYYYYSKYNIILIMNYFIMEICWLQPCFWFEMDQKVVASDRSTGGGSLMWGGNLETSELSQGTFQIQFG